MYKRLVKIKSKMKIEKSSNQLYFSMITNLYLGYVEIQSKIHHMNNHMF